MKPISLQTPSLFALQPQVTQLFLIFINNKLIYLFSGSGGGSSYEETLNSVCDSILHDFPDPFNTEQILEKYPVLYEESMNTVLN